MPYQNKVRKKCEKCGRAQVVPLFETVCHFSTGGLGSLPCLGPLELFAADREDALMNVLAIAREIHSKHIFAESGLLEEAIETISLMEEENQTPRDMGWVNDKGQP